MWLTLVIACLVAVLFTMPIVWLMGWRRPGAGAEESAVLSGIFLFVLVFLATWALSGWLAPWGPALSGVPWLLVLIGAAFVALLVLVASPSPGYSRAGAGAGTGTGTAGTSAGEAAEGIGLVFWVLVILLLVVGIVGNTREAW